ncbi:unnamed protein product [Rotaria sordida]|uniref:HPP transmembrane region domain-containing protein n=1 Tax=Rotaria sordida TaxID=392033 RepID=A0A818S8D7_9BILA|nr:unnamed protein product [Rotaria sordida]CAF1326740.1 unnamed protein product [Rotaria sordida]CAF1417674.1 unnamed protein product [Rotaria sordida]CAF1499449.1 unnamed protein product [Rotaria sordida]CAF1629281.1 unnamed protein product [Rotaria sordida]
MTTNSPKPAISIIDINHQEEAPPPDLIEVPSETLDKIENVEETDKTSSLIVNKCWKLIRTYVRKFHGLHEERPKRLPWQEYLWTFIGALCGIAAVAFFHFRLIERRQLSFLIGSFGASAAIVFGAPRTPLAQPRSLIGGHIIGATCGCVVRLAVYQFEKSMGCAIAVATTIVLTQLTETTHPPAGATALIAVTARPILPWANFQFILMPALSGACTMLLVALIVNNMAPKRVYPTYWW